MPRGGARKGAGRKPSSATVRTREIADRLSKDGTSPLEVMLDAMRYFHTAAREAVEENEGKPSKPAAEAYASAATIAKDAAPFMHPKLASIEHTNGDDGPFQIVIASGDAEL